eukprot:GILK01008055.1.p1 GENE.GILK01008055.1~~GILK01008055.1.p1  ORF type:complete len:231 (-),score=25.73 GILK01008055.1:183-854(-)
MTDVSGKVVFVNNKWCHQCRGKRTVAVCMHFDFQSGKTCKKAYCEPCLRSCYGERFADCSSQEAWKCPSCRRICTCPFCTEPPRLPPTAATNNVEASANRPSPEGRWAHPVLESLLLQSLRNTEALQAMVDEEELREQLSMGGHSLVGVVKDCLESARMSVASVRLLLERNIASANPNSSVSPLSSFSPSPPSTSVGNPAVLNQFGTQTAIFSNPMPRQSPPH